MPRTTPHRVVERRQRVLDAREQQEVHGGQEQQGTPLGERRAGEEREQVVVVGDGAADDGVGAAAVTLDDRGEASEVVGQRLLDEHGGQKLAGSSGVTAPKKNHNSTSVPTAPTP